MGIVDAIFHVLGFAMPAATMALVIPLVYALLNRFFKRKSSQSPSVPAQAAIIFIVCLAIQMAGLLFTGRDGKMVTYAAMMFASATAQWLLTGGWRKK